MNKKKPEEVRSIQVSVRMTPAIFQRIEAHANRAGISKSKFIENLIYEFIGKEIKAK